jgi:hypothetical protein
MLSFWMDRWFRHAYVVVPVLIRGKAASSAVSARANSRHQLSRAGAPVSRRLCLGIGDGSVRTQ